MKRSTQGALNVALICFLSNATFLTGCRREISGKYIAKFANGLCWLQLVKTPDSRLTGQWTEVLLKPDGKIEENNVTVNGAVDGKNVTFTATALGLSIITLSGILEGHRLTLTGAQATPIIFVRSELSDYQKEVNVLRTKAQGINDERAAAAIRLQTARIQEQFLSQIDETLRRMELFIKEAETPLARFAAAEERLHAITVRMTEYVNRDRQLAGNPNAAPARAQIGVATNQALTDTDEFNNAIQSFRSSLENVEPLTVRASDLEEACHQLVSPPGLTPEQIEARKDGCRRLFGADGAYRERFDAVARGLSHLEQVYAEERSAQATLVGQARQLQ